MIINHCVSIVILENERLKKKMMKEGKRQPAPPGFTVAFTEGDETLDMNDLYWYKGTYWGDCKAFKEKFTLK